MALVGGGGLREKYVFCVPRELQRLLSLFSLWEESVGAELNGGENSLHWKANMLPLFSIITLCGVTSECWGNSFQIIPPWFNLTLPDWHNFTACSNWVNLQILDLSMCCIYETNSIIIIFMWRLYCFMSSHATLCYMSYSFHRLLRHSLR